MIRKRQTQSFGVTCQSHLWHSEDTASRRLRHRTPHVKGVGSLLSSHMSDHREVTVITPTFSRHMIGDSGTGDCFVTRREIIPQL